MRGAVRGTLALVAITASGCGGGSHAPAPIRSATQRPVSVFRGNAVSPVYPAPRFALRDQSGRVVRLGELRGKVVLVTFLYTHCPDVCPLIASRLNAALGLLPRAARARTRVLAVSVDPAHDTHAAVERFIAEHRLRPEFRYLTGNRARLRPIWQAYNVIAAPASERVVDHSAYTTLVDRRGRVRVFFDSKALTSDIAHDVERLLEAQPEP